MDNKQQFTISLTSLNSRFPDTIWWPKNKNLLGWTKNKNLYIVIENAFEPDSEGTWFTRQFLLMNNENPIELGYHKHLLDRDPVKETYISYK